MLSNKNIVIDQLKIGLNNYLGEHLKLNIQKFMLLKAQNY